MLQEFKKFLLRGNVVDLAVGVIIGGMFNKIVASFSNDLLIPFIGIFFKAADLTKEILVINSSEIRYGVFLSEIINFVLTGFGVFVIVKLINKFNEKIIAKPVEVAPPTTKKCPFCCSEISIEATKCPHCTSDLSLSD